jgi:hypothetical protein
MGCDIHCYAEQKGAAGIYECFGEYFEDRSYGIFGFLADVRNYSGIDPIISQRRGIPEDVSQIVSDEYRDWGGDAHGASWLSLAELRSFDYEAVCEDRRCTREIHGVLDGGCTSNPGEGERTTYREFLGPYYFEELAKLEKVGATRIVFWFDN